MPTTARIEIFRDLLLRTSDVRHLRESLIAHAVGPWAHDHEHEDELHDELESNVTVFTREAGDGVEAVMLVLWPKGTGLEVTNIVPRKVRELSFSQYNRALEDFVLHVVTPAKAQCDVGIEMTSNEAGLEDMLPPAVATALRQFSVLANKSTGTAHPLDRERWFRFLILAHRANAKFNTTQLSRWLTEVEKWPDDTAHELVVEYETGRALLAAYDDNRS